MLQRALRLAGYHAETFATGAEFLAALPHRQPACVILDVHMPGMSGLAVEEQMRSLPVRIPVIFITASDEVSLEGRGCDTLSVRLLSKPFTSEALFDAVGSALRRASPGP